MHTHVIGIAVHPPAWRILGKRLEEIVFDVSRDALDDAGIEREQIEGVTIAGCDELDGRSISSMLLAMPAGAYLKDEIKCTDTGLYALLLGAMRVEAGVQDLGLVVSWNQSSMAPFEDVMRMRCDPFYVRPIGLNGSICDGLLAQALSVSMGIDEDAATGFVMESYRNAARNKRAISRSWPIHDDVAGSPYVALPLRQGHKAPVTDGAVAMVIASERWLARHPHMRSLARIAGMGWATDSYALNADRLSSFQSFRRATSQAIERAGIGSFDKVDLFELDCQTGYHGAAYDRVLGIDDPGRRNPSGGAFAQNPYFCTGLLNAAEAVWQVAGTAGSIQRRDVRAALAHASHGFAQQGNGAVVFERAH